MRATYFACSAYRIPLCSQSLSTGQEASDAIDATFIAGLDPKSIFGRAGHARRCRLLHLSPRAGRGRIPSEAKRSEPPGRSARGRVRSEEHTSELQSLAYIVCRLLLEKKKIRERRRASIQCRARMHVHIHKPVRLHP